MWHVAGQNTGSINLMKYAQRVALFRDRVGQIIRQHDLNYSQFANSIGVDRSTLSQLLSENNLRLPRADTLASIAEHYQLSVDWLLGLTDEGSLDTELVARTPELERYKEANFDSRLIRWYQESQHYKVRYIPSSIPDFMKLESVARAEFKRYGVGELDQSIRESNILLSQLREGKSEMEVCQSLQEIEIFARGQGTWSVISADDRRRQLAKMIEFNEELYPRFRWFLYDGREIYNAPFTIFGPLRAVVFLGQQFLVLNSAEHIQLFTQRFDELIRHTVVHPHDINTTLQKWLDEII